MTTPTPEAIEAAARALWQWFEENAASNSAAPTSADRELAREALIAGAPFIAAQALRAAADDILVEKCGRNYNPDVCETCRAAEELRNRAATIEGK